MSLFKSLKGTFQSVQHDLSAGLKSLSTPERSTTQIQKHSAPALVNYDAGADLLQKHHLIWEDLYKYTDETARKAQDADIDIGKLYIYYDRQSEVLTRFHEQCASFPVIINQLQEITDLLAAVDEECDKVEAALVYLENICEEQDLLRNKQAHQKQLAAYKHKKAQELERTRIKLAKEHAQKVESVNKKRKSLLTERQSAYEEQFSQDVDFYKKHGKPGRLPSTPESEKKLDLADVEIEADDGALDEFLATSSSDVALADQADPDTGRTENTDSNSDTEDTPKIEIAPPITSPLSELDIAQGTNLTQVESETSLDQKESETSLEQKDSETSLDQTESGTNLEEGKKPEASADKKETGKLEGGTTEEEKGNSETTADPQVKEKAPE